MVVKQAISYNEYLRIRNDEEQTSQRAVPFANLKQKIKCRSGIEQKSVTQSLQ